MEPRQILKIVTIGCAVLMGIFTVGAIFAHLTGRLVGVSQVVVVGCIAAEAMIIGCAMISCNEKVGGRLMGTAIVGELLLSVALVVGATFAVDLEWQDKKLSKADERKLALKRAETDEKIRLLGAIGAEDRASSQSQAANVATVSASNKTAAAILARKDTKTDAGALKPVVEPTPAAVPPVEEKGVVIAELGFYERYGLTAIPLLLTALVGASLVVAAFFDDARKSATTASTGASNVTPITQTKTHRP